MRSEVPPVRHGCPCDAALASLYELRGRHYALQELVRIMTDEITLLQRISPGEGGARESGGGGHRVRASGFLNAGTSSFLITTLEFRPLWMYFSRRAGGRSSRVPSTKPPFNSK
jgi:hypothetical protein